MAARSRSPLRAAGLSLRGKRALVTGGSKGIGRATAELFLELGAEVAICARGEEELLKVKEVNKERCHTLVADLSTQQGVKAISRDIMMDEMGALGCKWLFYICFGIITTLHIVSVDRWCCYTINTLHSLALRQ